MLHRALFWIVASAAVLVAQDDAARRIDEILKQWSKPGTPGAAVAVIEDGKLTYQKGYGAANLEYDVPIAQDTVFHVASVSKQFTAMSIVLLEQDGKLSLDDDVHKYLSELPDYGHRLTIRNLLQHTSGIRDQWQTLGLAGWRLDDVITQKQILRMLFRQRELNFEPGTQHLYSNGGFTLLAEIVARVSGKPLPEFCDERIFRPLGMGHTHFHDDHRRIVPNRAYSYEPAGGGFRASPLNYANVGATSLFTTAPDLAKWLDNFREPKVGGAKAVARLQEQAILSNGETIPYALGLAVGKYRGLRTISHGGSDAGYRSFVAWFPEQRLGIAVLSNLANFNPGSIANQIATVYLERQMTAEPPTAQAVARTFIKLEPGAIDQYEGYYRLGDLLIQVVKKDGKLLAAPPGAMLLELKPMSPVRFYAEQMQAEVEFTPKAGATMRMKLTRQGGTVEGEQIAFTPFDPKDLEKYPGTYWSDELETQYTVLLKDGKLLADHSHHGEIALTPVAKDQFRSATWFMPEVKFIRDTTGKVTAMTLGGNRVAGVKFVRR
jgi:CubicO group peptidase (beta-lactamase class C family)